MSSSRRGEYAFTSHSVRRAREFGLPVNRVIEAIYDPEQTYDSPSKEGQDRQVRQRDDIAVVVDRISNTIVTVLPKDYENWEHDERRAS